MAAKGTPPDMTAAARHVYGPRPLGTLMTPLTRAAFRRRAPGTAQVLADWLGIVGPALAAVTVPRRLNAGTLTIACSGPIAMELQHLSGELIERINTALGSRVVTGLRLVQTTLAVQPAPLPPTDSPEVAARAESAVAGLADDELRAALAALGRAVYGASAGRARLPRKPGGTISRS